MTVGLEACRESGTAGRCVARLRRTVRLFVIAPAFAACFSHLVPTLVGRVGSTPRDGLSQGRSSTSHCDRVILNSLECNDAVGCKCQPRADCDCLRGCVRSIDMIFVCVTRNTCRSARFISQSKLLARRYLCLAAFTPDGNTILSPTP